jgi:hypothetical protein
MANAATQATSGREAGETGGATALVVAGGGAGLLGGALMMAVLWIGAAWSDRDPDPLEQLRAMGLTFLGSEGVEAAGPGHLAWGLFLHLVVSALLGIVFASILPSGFPYGSAAVVGIGYAGFVLGITTGLVLPALNPTLRAQMPALGGTWVIAHAVYGFAIGVGPWLRGRLHRRA